MNRLSQLERKTYRSLAVALEGDDCTNDLNERVEMSFVKGVIAKNSSNSPAGGVGAS
jgi:hypothetical protein